MRRRHAWNRREEIEDFRASSAWRFSDKLPGWMTLEQISHLIGKSDRDGEAFHQTFQIDRRTLHVLGKLGISYGELRARIKYEFPVTHCQHSYDCCGHWYSSGAWIHGFSKDGLTFTVSSYRNI